MLNPYQVKILVVKDPSGSAERRPILIHRETRWPVTGPNEWLLIVRRCRAAASTLAKEAHALAMLVWWAEVNSIELPQRLASGDGLTTAEIQTSLAPWMRRRRRESGTVRKLTVEADTCSFRLLVAQQYLDWQLRNVADKLPASDPKHDRLKARRDVVAEAFKEVAHGRTRPNEVVPLSSDQVAFLMRVCAPDARDNPWRDDYRIRWRNWIWLLLLLSYGLRRAETLKIYLSDIDLRDRRMPFLAIRRRPDDANDPRAREPAVKTEGRILPLDPYLVAQLDHYISEIRPKIPNARRTPFLLVSRAGRPIDLTMANKILQRVVAVHGATIPALNPHLFRHTFNDRFYVRARALQIPEEDARKAARYINGWQTDNEIYTLPRIREIARTTTLAMQALSRSATPSAP